MKNIKRNSNNVVSKFNLILELNHLVNKTRMSSHVGTVVVEGFHPRRKPLQWSLGGVPREASHMLTFSLSKASPDMYSTYRIEYKSC
jgi:hypothetical protein